MSELDHLKEKLVYLRLWLGILVVAEISLVGWLASGFATAAVRLVSLAFVTGVSLALGILLLHRQIKRRIDEIRKL